MMKHFRPKYTIVDNGKNSSINLHSLRGHLKYLQCRPGPLKSPLPTLKQDDQRMNCGILYPECTHTDREMVISDLTWASTVFAPLIYLNLHISLVVYIWYKSTISSLL